MSGLGAADASLLTERQRRCVRALDAERTIKAAALRLGASPHTVENHLRAAWRGSLALGTVPAVLVFLWRLNMDEPERYKKDSMKHAKIPYLLILRRRMITWARWGRASPSEP